MDLLKNIETIGNLLNCQHIICTNIQIPVSIQLIDDILVFLTEINIKQFKIDKSTMQTFNTLHTQMCDLMFALIQYRHFFIVNRVPQFVNIFKDLLQSVCWYKCEQQMDGNLEIGEITMLAELSHKLEK